MARKVSNYVPLRCRSPYSILEGATKIDELAKRLREWRMPAVGLTDTTNLCAALEFSEKMCAVGVQPIVGCTLMVDLETGDDRFSAHGSREFAGTIVLLAQSELGYKNLMKLSSLAFLDVEPTDLPHIKVSTLKKYSEDLIALTGGGAGFTNRLICAGQVVQAKDTIELLAEWFEDKLYIEIQRHDLPHETLAEPILLDFAYDLKLPIVATNEPYFLDKDMHTAHDALLAIAEGSYVLETDRRHVSKEQYLKTPEEMTLLFSDLPEAIENTVDIAKRCSFRSPKRAPILPNFGDGSQSEADILADQAKAGLVELLSKIELVAPREAYFERLDFELGVIKQMGFPGYFLIVADFIKWANAQGIPVGPGRGSGAGSVVAWALTITGLDPLRYGLLFERFLNPERVSMPDFDIDFCQERRGEVIRYVQEKYGEDQVAHIITFGTLQARAVVRDVGRVLQMPLGQVDRLAKLVPSNPANPVTLSEAIKIEPALQRERDQEPAVAELLNKALQLEGLYRNASTHAAGVVIGDRPLTELVPLYLDPRSDVPATQFTMKWVEKAGLVKFDFLGLKTLTVIDRVLKYLKKSGIDLDMEAVPVTDKQSYIDIGKGFSQGVFQLESTGMRDTLRKMAPDSIEELTALISLYRPGPMKNIDSYIDRKYGREEITYPHPSLEEILKETYGIIIYQEQVMQIAQVLSGYSLGDADILRRAMGKKDKDEMAHQKFIFIDGAAKNGVKEILASQIFELVNKFAGYGFNKSHAAAYATISFRTAYLKAHHPVEFMAACMSLDINNVEKLSVFHQEAKRMNIKVVTPCVNQSSADFEVADGKVFYALGAIKNVGLEAMRHLTNVREQGGAFKDMFDFARRVDARIINKRAYENLARCGGFDCLEPNRAIAFASAGVLQSIGVRAAQERNSTQVNLFGEETSAMTEPELPMVKDWVLIKKLDNELKAAGFYLSGHPLQEYVESFAKRNITMFDAAQTVYNRGTRVVRMAGVLHKRQERISQRTSKRFAYVSLSDPTGEFETFVGEDILVASRELLQAGTLLELQIKLDSRDGELRMTVNSIKPLSVSGRCELGDEPIQRGATGLNIYLRNARCLEALKKCIAGLETAPAKTKGKVNIFVPVEQNKEIVLKLSGRYSLEDTFQAALKAVPGVEKINEY
ncbi:MAG: DNA polymerase III subunit alpha [Robiginitomaculum sp.]